MSKYTTEVRFICETAAGYDSSQGYMSVNQILNVAAPKVFDFDFPIFDEAYRSVLEKKILKHFYTREIGLETVGLWKLKLDTKLNEIMPLYNQYYKSELIEFNPMYDVEMTKDYTLKRDETADTTGTADTTKSGTSDLTGTRKNVGSVDETGTKDGSGTDIAESRETVSTGDTTGTTSKTDGTNSTTNEGGSTRWDLYSDTPQGDVTGVEQNKYLTNARKNTDTASNLTTGTDSSTLTSDVNRQVDSDKDGDTEMERSYSEDISNKVSSTDDENTSHNVKTSDTENRNTTENKKIDTLDEYLEHVKGKTAGSSFSKMLLEFRQTFMNIDMLIIDELEELFIGLW